MSEEENVQHLPAQVTISKPPLNILFNPNIVGKKNVWDIDITSLLEKLLVILNAAGNKDLRLCGVAALSSAMILRLKVESIFALEKIAMQHKSTPDRSMLENLEVLDMPYRYEATYPVSLEDLLGVLENMLGRITNPKKKELEIEPIESSELDKYLVTFDQLLEKYKDILLTNIQTTKTLVFSEFIKGMESIEVARYFVGILYLAMYNKIDVEQIDDDIKLILKE
ncbi:MAG: chromosome segregation protein ScpA [Thaumarchaeota archaeon]|nr:chromosome segregation protein ScpA [Nitrososphaerota archaeon]